MEPSYLEATPWTEWSYDGYKEFRQRHAPRRIPREKALLSDFRLKLQNLNQKKGLSREKKRRIEELLTSVSSV